MDLFVSRFNNTLPKFVSSVPDPKAWKVDALSLQRWSGCLYLSSSGDSKLGGHQISGSRFLQNDPHCSRLVKHALVLESSQSVGLNFVPAQAE